MSLDNPMGTNGFEFLEFSAPDPCVLEADFIKLGFTLVGKHRSKNVSHYQQGDIHFILNAEPNSAATEYAKQHGAGTCAMGFRVHDADAALNYAHDCGAQPFTAPINPGELAIPAICGIGGTVIYLVDRYGDESIYEVDFEPVGDPSTATGNGLNYIDHVTHNVRQGKMDKWARFYENIFNFREVRNFNIQGQHTGLLSRAMTSPCGKIRIPINEATDDKSQIEEFISEYNGEGIQHIALGTDNIYDSVETLRQQDIHFLDVPDAYYEAVSDRVPWHQEDLSSMQKNKILLDGDPTPDGGLLLQIFTENMLGPVFFEVIQRKGNEGFGEGNFQALFEAMERDQMRRGVL